MSSDKVKLEGRAGGEGFTYLLPSFSSHAKAPCPCSGWKTNEAKSKEGRDKWWREKKKKKSKVYWFLHLKVRGGGEECEEGGGGVHIRVGHERVRLIKYLPG